MMCQVEDYLANLASFVEGLVCQGREEQAMTEVLYAMLHNGALHRAARNDLELSGLVDLGHRVMQAATGDEEGWR